MITKANPQANLVEELEIEFPSNNLSNRSNPITITPFPAIIRATKDTE
jgi:hypothetical protein